MNMGSYSNSMGDCRLDSFGWGCGPLLGYCQHSDEYSGSMKMVTYRLKKC